MKKLKIVKHPGEFQLCDSRQQARRFPPVASSSCHKSERSGAGRRNTSGLDRGRLDPPLQGMKATCGDLGSVVQPGLVPPTAKTQRCPAKTERCTVATWGQDLSESCQILSDPVRSCQILSESSASCQNLQKTCRSCQNLQKTF